MATLFVEIVVNASVELHILAPCVFEVLVATFVGGVIAGTSRHIPYVLLAGNLKCCWWPVLSRTIKKVNVNKRTITVYLVFRLLYKIKYSLSPIFTPHFSSFSFAHSSNISDSIPYSPVPHAAESTISVNATTNSHSPFPFDTMIVESMRWLLLLLRGMRLQFR